MTLAKKILIVEDEVITQRYLRGIFEQYEVEKIACVDNGKDALAVLKKDSYDMVLMDINIKGSIDGILLSREILKHYSLPIIFISAYTDEKTLEEVLELSPYGFISKPFTSKEVVIALRVAYKRFLTHELLNSKKDKNDYITISRRYAFSLKNFTLYDNEEAVKLSMRQGKLLAILVKNLNHTVSFEVINRSIWGSETIENSTLRTLVYSIRKQLPNLPLHSYSKQGYYLRADLDL